MTPIITNNKLTEKCLLNKMLADGYRVREKWTDAWIDNLKSTEQKTGTLMKGIKEKQTHCVIYTKSENAHR